jgi:anaerobic selenocysteine-containing dehydrogenase
MHRARNCLLFGAVLIAASTTVSSQTPAPPPSLLISRQLAESHGLHIGDIVRLSADRSGTNARAFRIAGVYEPTPDPMRFAQQRLEARLHLPDLVSITADRSDPATADTITSINVAPGDPSQARTFARDATRPRS